MLNFATFSDWIPAYTFHYSGDRKTEIMQIRVEFVNKVRFKTVPKLCYVVWILITFYTSKLSKILRIFNYFWR
jgi:hypothetical protein